VLNEGQRQYERFQASQKDSVTYSIPSSIWRQDPPKHIENEERDHYNTEQQREHRPMSSTSPRLGKHPASSLVPSEPQEHHTVSTNPERTLQSSHNEQPGKGWHLPSNLGEVWERQVPVTWEGSSTHRKTNSAARNIGWDESGDEQQRSDSFYWQSPHSSIHSTKDEQGKQPIEIKPAASMDDGRRESVPETESGRNEHDTTTHSMLLSHSTLGTYGASALGFGGPSDWEHFGDYEAEDIDDTELYLRPRSPIKDSTLPEKAELPAGSMQNTNLLATGVQPISETNIEAKSLPQSEVTHKQNDNEQCSGDATTRPSHLEGPVQDLAMSEGNNQEALMDNGQAESSHALPADDAVMSPASDTTSSNVLDTDLDTTIKAWSTAGLTENSIDTERVVISVSPDVASTDHKLAPTAKSTVQSDSLVPPLARDDSAAGDASTHHPAGGHATDTNPASVRPREANGALAEKPDQEHVLSAAPTPVQPKLIEISQDQKANSIIEPDLVDHQVSAHQPTLAPAKSPSTKTHETEDPYAGLDAWGKASLNRYIAMLREESRAEVETEKFTIFTIFTSRETRLRAVLYDADQEQTTTPTVTVKANPIVSPIKRASTTSYKRASKALPALPESARDHEPPKVNGHARKPSKKLSATAILGNPRPALKALDTTNTSSTDTACAVVDSPNSVQYSPGGRPLVTRAPKTNNHDKTAVGVQDGGVDGINDDSLPNNHNDLPIPTATDLPADKNAAAYAPFRYSGSQSEAQNYAAKRLSKRQSVLRPYSKLMGSDEHRQIFHHGMPSAEDILKVPTNGNVIEPSSTADGKVDLDLRRFVRADFDPLNSVLPEAGRIPSKSLQLSDLTGVMDSVPDDFTFIHQAVIAWDTKAKRQRDSNERARHARQVESEQRIDALFDDHEIGYGDISELESGFKRSEAARKADEDRGEYQTFVSEVFNVVWTRLHYEIDQLAPHHQSYSAMLNDTTAGKDMFNLSSDNFALAPTMDSLLTLHQKLEIRHQKAFEAVLERDRRLKKVELSPWYSLGNVAKVKQLEKQFDVAEKKAILDYCRQRDIRANSLMDKLDQNTLRGVGANQDYMEMVMKAVRRIASGRAFASQPGSSEPGAGLEDVTKAESITKALATSSEQIVQTFHVADMLLNAADYELSVAKARLEGADMATLQNLKEERAKEDQKLMRDLEHRLALIREDSRRTHDEIVKLLLFLGVQSGHAEVSAGALKPSDPGHEERLQKALEEAKRRNATKETGATPLI